MDSIELEPARRAAGTVRLPGSKSISNRVLLLAALAAGDTEVSGLLDADDTRVMQEALAAHYAKSNTPEQFVKVLPPTEDGKLDALGLNDTNTLEIRVRGREVLVNGFPAADAKALWKGWKRKR